MSPNCKQQVSHAQSLVQLKLYCFHYQDEKYVAAGYCQQLEGERGGAMTSVLEEDTTPKSVSQCNKLSKILLTVLFMA